ncbi:MAG: hypothetical protein CMI30_03785 [Opitutae bacterium]|nr:hypothetical protein [Opitutae bacterium]|tara:strand:+ start:111 stop:1844 length:1734 start_codon:yes stop_codon:yes gene_type:complete
MTDHTQTLQPDSFFGKYRIIRLLGFGGMGEVYEAVDPSNGNHLAVKLIKSEVLESPEALNRFHREEKVMSALQHPGIVKIRDAGETDGRHWIGMELMSGWDLNGEVVMTLDDYIRHCGGILPQEEVAGIMHRLLEALGHAHEMGLVHRDVKPSNVLLGADSLKISDFGLVGAAGSEWRDTFMQAILKRESMDDTFDAATWMDYSVVGDSTRALFGTFEYMSPEQRNGLSGDVRSDLFSLGLMAFRMLSGRRMPGMERVSELGLDLSSVWDNWLITALKEQPDERFQSAESMMEGLRFDTLQAPVGNQDSDDEEAVSLALPLRVCRPTEGDNFNFTDLSMEMIWCKAGSFEMGSPFGEKGRDHDENQHEVSLSKGFWLGKHPLTQRQWKAVMGTNPSRFKGDDLPVQMVSWHDASKFCEKLTELAWEANSLPDNYFYHLPTEAQWEYACRANTTTTFSFGNSLWSRQANFDGNHPYGGSSTGPNAKEVMAVGCYNPNDWGFHDMHGNVWEWCHDWHSSFGSDPTRDPAGPATGSKRILRGGSWVSHAVSLRSASRSRIEPLNKVSVLGFRVCLCSPLT